MLTMVGGQLPATTHDAPVSIVGPAAMRSSIIAAAVISATDDLAEIVRHSPCSNLEAQARLHVATTAVAASVETYIECEALDWFNFDPAWDPVARVT